MRQLYSRVRGPAEQERLQLNPKRARWMIGATAFWLACLSFASPGFGQEQTTYNVNNWSASEADGTFATGINFVNGEATEDNTLFFTNDLINQTLSIDLDAEDCPQCLPTIDLGNGAASERKLELDAEIVSTTFKVLGSSESEDPQHNILTIRSGAVTLVDLDISGGDFEIQEHGILGFHDSAERGERTVEDVIKGAGKLIKYGGETLTLTGQNTYSGGSELRQGKLEGDRNGLQGSFLFIEPEGDNEQAILSFSDNGSEDWTFQGDTDGPGKVEKSGTSTLIVQGASPGLQHDGGTHVKEGILEGSASRLGLGPIQVDDSTDTELHFSQSESETFAYDITANGKVRKSGTGTLTLTGTNSFTGGLLIDEGEVFGQADSLAGDITFGEVGNLQIVNFNQDTEGQHNGAISGPGTIQKQGDQLLTLSGTVNQSVTTHVMVGDLRVESNSFASDVTVDSQTTIQFGQSPPVGEPYTYTGTITGQGNFEMAGTRTVVLSSAQDYHGTTKVSSGTLSLGTSLLANAQTTVESGATLAVNSPNQTVYLTGSGLLENKGTIYLPYATSSLSAGGEVQFAAGATLATVVDDSSQGLLHSNATIDITEGLEIDIRDVIENCTECRLMSAALIETDPTDPKVVFSLPAVKKLQPFEGNKEFEIRLLGDGFHYLMVNITTNYDAFDEAAQTPNQFATSGPFQKLLQSGLPGADALDSALGSIANDDGLRLVLDEVAGETLASFTTARTANAEQFAHALWKRFRAREYTRGWYNTSSSPETGGAPPVSAAPPEQTRFSSWAEPFGIFAENDGRDRASDIQSRIYGLSGGIEYELPESLGVRVGGALGYSRYSIIANPNSRMQGQANTYQAALYTAWQSRRFHVGIAGRYAYTSMRSQRRVTIGEIYQQTADAKFAGREGGAMIEIGATIGDPEKVALRPIASFQYDYLSHDAFRETGAGILSLAVAEHDYDSLLTTLGTRVSKLYKLDGGFGIEPEIRLGWTYQAGDKARPVEATFYSQPGALPFVTNGAEADRNAIWVGAGYVMHTAENVKIGLDYDAYIGAYYTRHVLSAGLQINW